MQPMPYETTLTYGPEMDVSYYEAPSYSHLSMDSSYQQEPYYFRNREADERIRPFGFGRPFFGGPFFGGPFFGAPFLGGVLGGLAGSVLFNPYLYGPPYYPYGYVW
ncbi:hypothetical protein J2S08_002958 [Bacillus chungangensis]|uniref:Spore coat protein n=2 Tax=Bacillus chungangensis TaxID=587633 RepID=A0ABT9WVE2_9BACI|nr:hypothetical protein [Bacillus chungangensis]